jgi:hypothetical protein
LPQPSKRSKAWTTPSASGVGHEACRSIMGGRCPRRDKLRAAKAAGDDDDSNSINAQETPAITVATVDDRGAPASLHADQGHPDVKN